MAASILLFKWCDKAESNECNSSEVFDQCQRVVGRQCNQVLGTNSDTVLLWHNLTTMCSDQHFCSNSHEEISLWIQTWDVNNVILLTASVLGIYGLGSWSKLSFTFPLNVIYEVTSSHYFFNFKFTTNSPADIPHLLHLVELLTSMTPLNFLSF